jgi:hypothetical protein
MALWEKLPDRTLMISAKSDNLHANIHHNANEGLLTQLLEYMIDHEKLNARLIAKKIQIHRSGVSARIIWKINIPIMA